MARRRRSIYDRHQKADFIHHQGETIKRLEAELRRARARSEGRRRSILRLQGRALSGDGAVLSPGLEVWVVMTGQAQPVRARIYEVHVVEGGDDSIVFGVISEPSVMAYWGRADRMFVKHIAAIEAAKRMKAGVR